MKVMKLLCAVGTLVSIIGAQNCGGEPESGNNSSVDTYAADANVSEKVAGNSYDGSHYDASGDVTVYDSGIPDANGGDDFLPDAQKIDGGDNYVDAGVREPCDEYLGNTIPAWANVKVPIKMFEQYCSNLEDYAAKYDSLEKTDINGENVVLFGGEFDDSRSSKYKIIKSEVVFGVKNVLKADGTLYAGLCGQFLGNDAGPLNDDYQTMMGPKKLR